MATLDTVKEVLESNLDIDPENVTEDATFEDLGNRFPGHGRAHLRPRGEVQRRFRRAGRPHHPSVTSSSTSTTCKLSSPNERARICGLFSFFWEMRGGAKTRTATGKRGGMHRGRSETRGRTRRLRQDAGTHAPASAGSLRAVAARKPCEHGGSHNEQTDRRHASDA